MGTRHEPAVHELIQSRQQLQQQTGARLEETARSLTRVDSVGLRISKVRRETDGKYYYCMYSQTSDTLDSYDKEDTEEFNELFKGRLPDQAIHAYAYLLYRRRSCPHD